MKKNLKNIRIHVMREEVGHPYFDCSLVVSSFHTKLSLSVNGDIHNTSNQVHGAASQVGRLAFRQLIGSFDLLCNLMSGHRHIDWTFTLVQRIRVPRGHVWLDLVNATSMSRHNSKPFRKFYIYTYILACLAWAKKCNG